jgi:glyceraldehyde-3-phosphate dehydrogenase (NAD(P))
VAQVDDESTLGREATRVVPYFPTNTVRIFGALRKAGLLKKARGVLIRRATPGEHRISQVQ